MDTQVNRQSNDSRVAALAAELVSRADTAGIRLSPLSAHEWRTPDETPVTFVFERRSYTNDFTRLVIKVGDRFGRHRSRGYSDRSGKGYDWPGIIAAIKEQDDSRRRFHAHNAAREAYAERAKARLTSIMADFGLGNPDPTHWRPFGPQPGIAISDEGGNTLELNLNMIRLSEDRLRDVLARLASVGLLENPR